MLISQLLKEGTKHLSGVDETVLKNIEAIRELSKLTRTSLGPNGMNKMVINKIGKLFVTNDAATILKELEVVHPAAKMCVLASEQQQQEIGDATNFVVSLTGEILAQAEVLLKMGLHASDVIRGFEKAGNKVAEILEGMVCKNVKDISASDEVASCLCSVISAKQFGYEDIFAPLIAKACTQVLPKDPKRFNVDNVRVAKILGGGITDAHVIKGVVIVKGAEGTIKSVNGAKVAVYAQGLDAVKTETKGKVYIEKASELEAYSKSEEEAIEEKIKEIHTAGVTLVISGGTIGELAMHFLEKYGIMVVKTASKFELRRICQVTNAKPMIRMAGPVPEEVGFVDYCAVEEVGGTKVTVLRQDKSDSGVATIIVRAATSNILDDIERAVDDCVAVYKAMARDARFVPGAGAAEIELARQLKSLGEKTAGQDQYAIKKFGEAFEVVPRTLAENAGIDATHAIATLYAKHEEGDSTVGIDVDSAVGVGSVIEKNIFDHMLAKQRAIELATQTVITILRISQIIMAKPAAVNLGGPNKSDTMGGMDTDEAI